MGRIAAEGILAKVVNLISRRNVTDEEQIAPAMGTTCMHLPGAYPDTQDAVFGILGPAANTRPSPDPTAGRLNSDFRHQPSLNISPEMAW